MKISPSLADTTGTRALNYFKDRATCIVLVKTIQAYLDKVTQCKQVGKYCSKEFYSPRLVGEFYGMHLAEMI